MVRLLLPPGMKSAPTWPLITTPPNLNVFILSFLWPEVPELDSHGVAYRGRVGDSGDLTFQDPCGDFRSQGPPAGLVHQPR